MRRDRKSCLASVLARQNLREIFERCFVQANIDERSDNRAHHIPQKTIGGNGKNQLVVLFRPKCFGDVAVVRVHIGVRFGKTFEIGMVEQHCGCLVHQIDVEILLVMPAQILRKNVFVSSDEILVGAFLGIEARVRAVGGADDFENGNVFGQKRIELVYDCRRVDFIFGVEMREHFLGVHTGIGAACANEIDAGIENRGHRLVHRFLYGHGIGLVLPAVVMGAVVGKSDEVAQVFVFLDRQR